LEQLGFTLLSAVLKRDIADITLFPGIGHALRYLANHWFHMVLRKCVPILKN
jgi:hypothetical protein